MAANSVPGSDVIFDWKDIKHGYRFLRKFWNAFRFISMQIFDEEVSYDEIKDNFDPLDLWILSKLNNLNKVVDNALQIMILQLQSHQLKSSSGMISVMNTLKQ